MRVVWEKFKDHYSCRFMPDDDELTAYFNNQLEILGVERLVRVKCEPPIPFEMLRVITVTPEDLPRVVLEGIL